MESRSHLTPGDAAAGVPSASDVGPSLAVGDGTEVGVRSAVGAGPCVRVGDPSGAAVGSAAGVANWAGAVEGTDSSVAAGSRIAVGSASPQAVRRTTMGTNADNASPIRNSM